jgi:hypothetical protein
MLIVEDGSIVAGANTYVSDNYFTNFCSARGIDFPDTAEARSYIIITGMDYVESFRREFKGLKTSGTQDLQWPRTGVYIDNTITDSSFIPVELKNALCQAAIESIEIKLFESSDGTSVKKEKLDTLEIEYFERGSTGTPVFAAVDAYLSELLSRSAKTYKLVRV